jgi:predicted  nucleic acid-binding Zn-ribbon protein
LIDGGQERIVGQYPNVPAEDALSYFTRKFDDLAAQVRTLEQRLAAGITDAKSLKTTREHLKAELVEPKAVGNVQNLRDRVEAVTGLIDATSARANEERAAANQRAMAAKEEIAARAESIVANLGGINWKKSAVEMTELFERWQKLQKEGPKVPKAKTDPIWKRFSQARAKFEAGRRAFFSNLDGSFKEAKAEKTSLVDSAKALVTKGAGATDQYKKLQNQWKLAGKAGKAEESLWKEFRAAGDAIFAAKKAEDAEIEISHKANLEKKIALNLEIEALNLDDIESAKKALANIQARWEKIGHIPRDQVRKIEDPIRKIEKKIADAAADAWRRSDPAAKARSNSLVSQLEEAIAGLEKDLEQAKPEKKIEIEEQITARKAWLLAASQAVD